jgi:4-amino-4-deoxy-L-arabinose transferase-like glycosyltransferase
MRKHKLNYVVIIIGGLMIAGAAMSLLRCYSDPGFNSDALHHLMPIHNLIDGKGYTYRDHPDVIIPPGYGIASYLAFLFVRDIEYSGVVISALSYILLIPLIYITTRFLFSRETGLLAAWLTTFFPALVALSSSVGSDALSCLCILLGFYTYLRLLQGAAGPGFAVWLGSLLGFAYLVRPENFLISILAIGTLFIFWIRDLQISHRGDRTWALRKGIIPILVVILFLAFVLPYVFFLKQHTGRWTLSTKGGINMLVGETSIEGPHHKIEGLDKMFASGSSINFLEYVRSQGWKYGVRVFRTALIESYTFVMQNFHAIVPLILLWLAYPFVSARRLFNDWQLPLPPIRIITAFLVFLSPLPVYSLFYIEPRYLVPSSLLILIPLSFLVVTFLNTMLASVGKQWMKSGIALLCFISIFSSIAVGFLGYIPRVPPQLLPDSLYHCLTNPGNSGYRPAGEWLGKHVEGLNDVTLLNPGRPDVILFYASGKKDIPGRGVPVGLESTLPELASLLESDAKAYLVVTREQVQLLNFQCPSGCPLAKLWNDPEFGKTAGLILVYEDSRGRFKVYKRDTHS